MPGTVDGPVIDLTNSSDDEPRYIPLAHRNSTHQSSKSATAGAALQGASPGSKRMSHLKHETASPRTGLTVWSGSSTMPAPQGSPGSRGMAPTTTPRKQMTQVEVTHDVEKLVSALRSCAAEMETTNAVIVKDVLDKIVKNPPQPRHVSRVDRFAALPSVGEEPASASEGARQIRFRLYVASDKPPRQKKQSVSPVVLRPTKEAVPKYRFHHVEIARNILTPSTSLRFLPYTRDVQNAKEENQYYSWLDSLKGMDQTDGMDTLALEESHTKENTKALFMARKEFAATLHPYLERWVSRLGLEHCDRSALIHYMASQAGNDDSAITPQQKSTLLESGISSRNSWPDSHAAAKAFTEAFDRVFGRRATLQEVLMLDEVVENLLQQSRGPSDVAGSQNVRDDEILRDLEDTMATNNLFNCLICFCYGCDHGSINVDANTQSRLSISNVLVKMAPMVKRRWIEQTKKNPQPSPANTDVTFCKNQCFQGSHPSASAPREWTPAEVGTLKAMYVALGKSSVRPECTAAVMLNRKCWDVREKAKDLKIALPYTPAPQEQPWAKNVGWYDRVKKTFVGEAWKDNITHDFQSRDLTEPCHHEGACTAANGCPCVYGRTLCDRFCLCTAESCPYKFAGCSCHASGKNCLERVKKGENPCICVVLNRECDPALCKGCGATERANPLNVHNHALHATGCQNVPMQRGLTKAVLMGSSQLEGCGYGLFTAEDIAQDEYVIEYTGELIKADEGIRREARRGNVFDESKNTSYLFTLLETEGVWVDAAVYGNLSRYINHATDSDKKGANLTPKIVYVLGEYRIRFTATRDIRRGEELFFNYGDNFPNLTKKLLEDKDAEEASSGKRKPGPKPGSRKPGRPPSKMVKNKQEKDEDFGAPRTKGGARPRGGGRGGGKATKKAPRADEMDWEATTERAVANRTEEEDDDGTEEAAYSPSGSRTRRRGHHQQQQQRGSFLRIPPPPDDADDYDEYRPGTQTDSQEDNEAAMTLALARQRRRKLGASDLRDVQDGGGPPQKGVAPSSFAVSQTTPKKDGGGGGKAKRVSRRGGARPGAGRKPKNATAATKTATPTKRAREAEDDDETEEEIQDSYAGAEEEEEVGDSEDDDEGPVERGRGYSLRTRKRKSADWDGEDGEEDEEEGDDSGFVDHGRGDVSELGARSGTGSGGSKEGEEEEDDSDDVIDRSRRKRQKPARYRGDEE